MSNEYIQVSFKQRQAILQEVHEKFPKEVCGFLTATDFIPLENISETPETSFKIDPIEYAIHIAVATSLVHTHNIPDRRKAPFDPRTPSYADFIAQKKTGLPWLIYGTDGQGLTESLQFPRIPNSTYLDRDFIWFINDCYTLVQDWYKFELGITLKDYILTQDYQSIRCLNDLFTNYIEDFGFNEVKLKDIRRGDLLLLDNAGFKRNHLGIFDGKNVLHQSTRSVIVPFETFIGRINKVLRYVG